MCLEGGGANMTVTSSIPDVCTWGRNEELHVNCSRRTGTLLFLYSKVLSCVFFCLRIVNDFNLLLPTNAQLLLLYFIYSLKLTATIFFLLRVLSCLVVSSLKMANSRNT